MLGQEPGGDNARHLRAVPVGVGTPIPAGRHQVKARQDDGTGWKAGGILAAVRGGTHGNEVFAGRADTRIDDGDGDVIALRDVPGAFEIEAFVCRIRVGGDELGAGQAAAGVRVGGGG